eukprot:194233_1
MFGLFYVMITDDNQMIAFDDEVFVFVYCNHVFVEFPTATRFTFACCLQRTISYCYSYMVCLLIGLLPYKSSSVIIAVKGFFDFSSRDFFFFFGHKIFVCICYPH